MRILDLPRAGLLRSSWNTLRPRSAWRPTPATVYACPAATLTSVVSTGGDFESAPATRIETAYSPTPRLR